MLVETITNLQNVGFNFFFAYSFPSLQIVQEYYIYIYIYI